MGFLTDEQKASLQEHGLPGLTPQVVALVWEKALAREVITRESWQRVTGAGPPAEVCPSTPQAHVVAEMSSPPSKHGHSKRVAADLWATASPRGSAQIKKEVLDLGRNRNHQHISKQSIRNSVVWSKFQASSHETQQRFIHLAKHEKE